ncbi:hypothetical protein AMATHDRAFT_48690 [Amanita thiersii Skay4041]|uniref:Uncharacterized protein n=1 Tax=Amanita thiersii Skay4041 TaxID=703135 RepID=A0A2A9NP01_9AGAR|nr:hypothetical protein AMATHDRAFT_48690 [Amanita thiersii Skay4041]
MSQSPPRIRLSLTVIYNSSDVVQNPTLVGQHLRSFHIHLPINAKMSFISPTRVRAVCSVPLNGVRLILYPHALRNFDHLALLSHAPQPVHTNLRAKTDRIRNSPELLETLRSFNIESITLEYYVTTGFLAALSPAQKPNSSKAPPTAVAPAKSKHANSPHAPTPPQAALLTSFRMTHTQPAGNSSTIDPHNQMKADYHSQRPRTQPASRNASSKSQSHQVFKQWHLPPVDLYYPGYPPDALPFNRPISQANTTTSLPTAPPRKKLKIMQPAYPETTTQTTSSSSDSSPPALLSRIGDTVSTTSNSGTSTPTSAHISHSPTVDTPPALLNRIKSAGPSTPLTTSFSPISTHTNMDASQQPALLARIELPLPTAEEVAAVNRSLLDRLDGEKKPATPMDVDMSPTSDLPNVYEGSASLVSTATSLLARLGAADKPELDEPSPGSGSTSQVMSQPQKVTAVSRGGSPNVNDTGPTLDSGSPEKPSWRSPKIVPQSPQPIEQMKRQKLTQTHEKVSSVPGKRAQDSTGSPRSLSSLVPAPKTGTDNSPSAISGEKNVPSHNEASCVAPAVVDSMTSTALNVVNAMRSTTPSSIQPTPSRDSSSQSDQRKRQFKPTSSILKDKLKHLNQSQSQSSSAPSSGQRSVISTPISNSGTSTPPPSTPSATTTIGGNGTGASSSNKKKTAVEGIAVKAPQGCLNTFQGQNNALNGTTQPTMPSKPPAKQIKRKEEQDARDGRDREKLRTDKGADVKASPSVRKGNGAPSPSLSLLSPSIRDDYSVEEKVQMFLDNYREEVDRVDRVEETQNSTHDTAMLNVEGTTVASNRVKVQKWKVRRETEGSVASQFAAMSQHKASVEGVTVVSGGGTTTPVVQEPGKECRREPSCSETREGTESEAARLTRELEQVKLALLQETQKREEAERVLADEKQRLTKDYDERLFKLWATKVEISNELTMKRWTVQILEDKQKVLEAAEAAARKELEEERRRRVEAEMLVDDIKRECREPFVAPALLEAFRIVSKVTTKVCEMEEG